MFNLLHDFYSFSLIYEKDRWEDQKIAERLFPAIKSELLHTVLYSINSELGHLPLKNRGARLEKIDRRFRGNDPKTQVRRAIVLFDAEQFPWRLRGVAKKDDCWSFLYGGPAWQNICRRWLELYDNEPNIVNIDRMIDISHNTGNVLNKKYPYVDLWLTRKTNYRDFSWIVDQCSFRSYAYRRIYDKYGITREMSKML